MEIRRNYESGRSMPPITLIFRLEEGLEKEGIKEFMNAITGLSGRCLPREKNAETFPSQLIKLNQRFLIAWFLLIMHYEKYSKLLDSYIDVFVFANTLTDVNEELAQEIQLWIKKELCSRIRRRFLTTKILTIYELERKQSDYADNKAVMNLIKCAKTAIYETHHRKEE